jgi:cyclohexadienyl dehydratase
VPPPPSHEVLTDGAVPVCTTGDYRPYPYLYPDTQEWSGKAITMAENLAETLGVELELVQTTWSDLLVDPEAQCDIAMGGISFNTDRAQEVFVSTATVQDGKAPISRCEDVDRYALSRTSTSPAPG